MLGVLAHLEYKPWFALAEYVDNALASFAANRSRLGTDRVRVTIDFDDALRTITVRDDAAGIALADFPRAFRPAEVPPDRGGLSEFGMGMKSASCWFAPRWEVRTSALGDACERRVRFDVARIVEDKIEELAVEERPAPADAHYTAIELQDCRVFPVGRTLGKVREHLADIYRDFLRSGELELTCVGKALAYEEPPVLRAPRFDADNAPHGAAVTWRKELAFDFGGGQRAHGFAGLLKKGGTGSAGFSLFRRRRVIQGNGDEKYRPREIFGTPTTFAYQRLFGDALKRCETPTDLRSRCLCANLE